MKNKNSFCIILFFAVLVAGFLLRVYSIDREAIWYDESYAYKSATEKTIPAIIDSVNEKELHSPPLYFILLHYWINMFGTTEYAMRFFSVIFGLLSIFMIYLIAKRFSTKMALIASLMLATSVVHVLYSQETRLYSFFCFLTLVSFYFFIKVVKENKKSDYVFYTIVTLLAVYTVQFAFVAIALQNIYLFLWVKNKKITRRWIYSQLAVFILFLPGMLNFLVSVKLNYIDIFARLVDKYHFPQIMANPYFMIPILFVCMCLAIFILFKIKPFINNFFKNFGANTESILFIFILFLLLALIPKFFIKPVFLTRYLLFLTPLYYLFIAYGMSRVKSKSIFSVMVVLILIFNFTNLYLYYTTPIKPDWRSTVKYVDENAGDNDILLFDVGIYSFDYYSKRDITEINIIANSQCGIDLEKTRKDIENTKPLIDTKEHAWLIITRPWIHQGVLTAFMDTNYKLTNKIEFNEIEVYYYLITKNV